MIRADWEVIKVIEEKGLFDNFIGNKKESIGGKISSSPKFFNYKSMSEEGEIKGKKTLVKSIFFF